MITEKVNVTQSLLDGLSEQGNKISFMPDIAVVEAIRLLEEKGIPNNKHEDYKYCNLEAVLRKEFKKINGSFNSSVQAEKYKLNNSIHIVVVNGEYQSALSDQHPQLTICSLEEAEKSALTNHLCRYADVNSDAMVALNTAFSNKGLLLRIKGIIEQAIQVINITSAQGNAVINPRQLIIAENQSQATIIETFVSENQALVFQNHLSEVVVGENANIKSFRIQEEDQKAYQVNTTQVHVKRYGNYETNTYTFGGALVRNNLNVVLADDPCEAHLNGLFIGNGQQLIDNHTLVDHQKPNGQSNELYKGIVKDKSTGVFNGKIFVRQDAQKTNAYQSSKNIVLSDEATINTKPQLEIYADDVKCSHGTSTGKVDEEALFYLKARGIGDQSARKLLLQAFAQELIDKIEHEELKEHVLTLFEKAL